MGANGMPIGMNPGGGSGSTTSSAEAAKKAMAAGAAAMEKLGGHSAKMTDADK